MTTILYIFAAMLAVGVSGTAVAFLLSLDDWPTKIIAACFVIPIGTFLTVAPFWAIESRDSPVLATLCKGEWSCTDSRVVTSMVMVGKVMVPQTTRVCVEYRSVR